MAQQRTVVLIDDLDGSDAQQTVTFSLDGQQYEIDLSAQNSQRLHEALAPFMSKARIAHSEPKPKRRTRRPRTSAEDVPQDAAPPADVTPEESPADVTPEESPASGSRPPVPAALFSDTTQQVAPRVAALKPQATELFSPAS